MNRFLLICLLAGPAIAWVPQRETPSDCFSIQSAGKGQSAHIDIFVRLPDGKSEYIGSASTRDDSETGLGGGLQMSVLAVSKDGRSLVFRHYPEFAKGRSKQEGGIYHYEYGKGARLVHKSGELVEFWHQWKKPLPRDVLAFEVWLEARVRRGPMMALTAEGEEFPLILLGGTPLHRAAYEGQTKEIEALLDKGEPIDARTYWGDTPLTVALWRANDEAAVRLLDRGAEFDSTTLRLAANRASLPALEALARRGANVNALWAGESGSGESSFFSGDDDDRRTWERKQQTPWAKILLWLLNHGVDPNGRDKEGKTFLHEAAHSMDLGAARILLERGADPNLTDGQGDTPLHLLLVDARTCSGGEGAFTGKPAEWEQSTKYQLLVLLVAKMQDINVRNTNGQTPLEIALLNGNELSPQFLIDHGAEASLRAENGLRLGQWLEKVRREWEALCKQ